MHTSAPYARVDRDAPRLADRYPAADLYPRNPGRQRRCLRRNMRNTKTTPAICIIDQRAMIVRNRFERIRYQQVPINGFLACGAQPRTGTTSQTLAFHARSRTTGTAGTQVSRARRPSPYELLAQWSARQHLLCISSRLAILSDGPVTRSRRGVR
jgi:hypothetical protein